MAIVLEQPMDGRLAGARRRFKVFIDGLPKERAVLLFHDWDADGITAAVVLQAALGRLGFSDVRFGVPDRGRDPWTPSNRRRIAQAGPAALFVLDLGVHAEPLLPGAPTCFIDHHRPEGRPRKALVLTSYAWKPSPNTSLLAWELCRQLSDIEELEWIAAIGVRSDLGETAPFGLLARAKARHGDRWLREATVLLNALRRSSRGDPAAAARALTRFSSPRELVESSDPDVELMRQARLEVALALKEAKRAAPVFAGDAALIRIRSACQIHPLLAQIWRSRLPKHFVIVANEGYIPGRVNFSARGPSSRSVLRWLRAIDIGPGEGSYGRGHDQASGGSLPVPRWRKLLRALGFEPDVR